MENLGISMGTLMGWVASIATAFGIVRYQVSVLTKDIDTLKKNHENFKEQTEKKFSDFKEESDNKITNLKSESDNKIAEIKTKIAVQTTKNEMLQQNFEKLDGKLDKISSDLNTIKNSLAGLPCYQKGGTKC